VGRPASAQGQKRPHPLEYIFHPRSVAIVGVSTDVRNPCTAEYYVEPLLKLGYKGKIYPVNQKGGEVLGLPVYASLKEAPGPIDHVISCIPAEQIPQLLDECREVGAKVLQLYTAGFAETGEPHGMKLQRQMVETAKHSNIRILGPNCMGLYCPRSGLSFSHKFPREPGPIGLISQSGSNSMYTVFQSMNRGLRFSKAISYGNASDINECDLLDYLTDDPETKVIAAYIEGTNDGPRFRQVLARAASTKPVVIYKGGYTEGGTRAATSHTGALSGVDAVWNGLLKQVGAIKVHTVEEMVDVLVALLYMKPPQGLNTCAAGNGGGASLLAADELERAGFKLPDIPPGIRDRLKTLIPPIGSMLRNPLDISPLMGRQQLHLVANRDVEDWRKGLEAMSFHKEDRGWGELFGIFDDWPGLDWVLLHISLDSNPGRVYDWFTATQAGPMLLGSRMCSKPAAMVLHYLANEHTWVCTQSARELTVEAGFPLFLSVRGAARAIRRLVDFNTAHPEVLRALREESTAQAEVP